MEKWLVIIITSILAEFSLLLFGAAYNSKVAQEDIEREKSVQSACMSAIESTDKTQDRVFDTEEELLDARKAFWFSYCRSNGYYAIDSGSKNYATNTILKENYYLEIDSAAKFEVPFVIYVDRDGYYVEYTRAVKNNGEKEYQLFLSEKQTFARSYSETTDRYIVTYRLDGRVVVVSERYGKSVEGTYSECYQMLGKPKALSFMESKESYWEEHDFVLTDILSDKINYYVNTHNTDNKLERKYYFAMPSEISEFGRMLRTPCVISFSQGKQSATQNINSYGFAGASIEKERMYYSYYATTINNETELFYTKDKNEFPDNVNAGSMRDLAKQGAIPDH